MAEDGTPPDASECGIRRAKDVVFEVVDGQTVLLHFPSATYYALNETGSYLWQQLSEGPMTDAQLVASLASQFHVDVAQCAQDVETLLVALRSAGLVENVAG